MNRRSFFRSLLLGVAALPVVGKLFADKNTVAQRSGSRRLLFTLPKEAGEFKSMKMTESSILVICCENGVWFSSAPYDKCESIIIGKSVKQKTDEGIAKVKEISAAHRAKCQILNSKMTAWAKEIASSYHT